MDCQSESCDSLYQALGISILASGEEIRQAYKKMALAHHPDRAGPSLEARERFQLIQHAYDVLKDSCQRADYDKALLHRLYLEEYLRRFDDLILTSSGLELPLENPFYNSHRTLHRETPIWQLSN